MPTTPSIGPDTIIPERAPSLGVALRFFLVGLAFLLTLLLTAIWKAPMLTADYLHNPATLAVTHLFTLGFGGSVVTGALYQMIPVLLYSKLHSERLANIHLVLHAGGALLMVEGFLHFQTLWVIIGGSTVLTGALLFILNLALTFKAAERWNWHGIFMVAAVIYYLSTLTWGIVMALNQHYGFLGEVEGAPLGGHLTLGLLGWFSLMIVGVGMKLVPMFAPTKSIKPVIVGATGGALGVSVPLILAGLWAGPALLWPALLLALAGLLGYAGLAAYAYLHRRKGPLDFSVRFSLTAALLLPLPAAAFLAGNFIASGRPLKAGAVFFFALAFIGGTILGMLLRIIPFMVWLHRFRNRTHKQEKVPFLHEMFQPRLGWIAYLTWFPGTFVMSLGVALRSAPAVIIGAVICLVGMGAYIWAQRQVLHHIPPGRPALFPGKPGK
jgi:hypothetical protein